MARPKSEGETRTANLNIRVTPSFKEKLKAHAKIAGRLLATDIEERLVRSVRVSESDVSPETRELANAIAAHVGEIEQATGKRWHEDVRTWAAVAGMLAAGPIMARAPAKAGEQDAALVAHYAQLSAIYDEREEITKRLKFIGADSLLISIVPTVGGRDELREYIDRQGYATEQLQRNYAEVDRLEELDSQERELLAAITAIVEPFEAAIEEGRNLSAEVEGLKGGALAAALGRIEARSQRGITKLLMLPTIPLPRPLSLPRGGMLGSALPGTSGEGDGLALLGSRYLTKPDAVEE